MPFSFCSHSTSWLPEKLFLYKTSPFLWQPITLPSLRSCTRSANSSLSHMNSTGAGKCQATHVHKVKQRRQLSQQRGNVPYLYFVIKKNNMLYEVEAIKCTRANRVFFFKSLATALSHALSSYCGSRSLNYSLMWPLPKGSNLYSATSSWCCWQ